MRPVSQELTNIQFEALANWKPENGTPEFVQDTEHETGSPVTYAQVARTWTVPNPAMADISFQTALDIAEATGWKPDTRTTPRHGNQIWEAKKCLDTLSAALTITMTTNDTGPVMFTLTIDEYAALATNVPVC